MKSDLVFPITMIIMILGLGLMMVNWLILPLPDWGVRGIGLLMLADLPVLVYSRIKFSKTINKKKRGL